MTKFSTIFFDLDNTLFDHHYSSLMGLSALQSEYSALKGHSLLTLERAYWDLLNSNYNRVLSGEISMGDARQERMKHYLAHFDVAVNDRESATAVSLYRSTYEANLRAVPGTEEVLNDLNGRFQLGIITNGLTQYQNQKLTDLKLQSYFSQVFASEAVGSKKPEAHIFETALQALNVSPETAVMVGDSWDSDIIGSTQLGLTAVWLNRFNETRPTTNNVNEIQNLSQLITTIDNI